MAHPLRKLLRIAAILAIASFTLSPRSNAQQLGHYIGGFTGLDSGTTAPPGFYAGAFGLVQPVDTIKGPGGNTVLRPNIDIGGVIAVYQVVFPQKILGGNYMLAFMVPVLNTRFNSNLFNISAQSAGVSDVLFMPVGIGWTKGRTNYTVNYSVYAPSGNYNPDSPLNPGLGFWEQQIQGGLTWNIDKAKRLNLSGLTTWEINQTKSSVDVKTGPIFTGEYGLGYRFFTKYNLMNAGVVGYASQKLSPDSGSAINPFLKGYLDRSFGSGAEWKFTDPIHKLAFDARYEWQYGAQLRTSGKIFIFSITYLDFLPPPKPSK
jgi:hypothetical protein